MSNKLVRTLEGMVLAGALATIPLTVLGEENPRLVWVQTADWVVWAIFFLEYAVMVATSSERALYIRRNPLNLAVVVLSYPHLPIVFGLVRLARFVRFLRFLRLMGVTARAIEALRTIFWRLTLLEPQTVRGGFGDGIWWAIVTASTVGYGDIAPSTLWGRLIAILLMLSGVGLVSTLAASITSYFLGQEESAILTELNERMTRIEGLLNRMLTDRFVAPTETPHEDEYPGVVGPSPAQSASRDGPRSVQA